MELGRWRFPHSLCYLSKVGASNEWLHPSLHATLRTLGEQNTAKVLVVTVAFVSDYVENLSEVNPDEMDPGWRSRPSRVR
ncbi:MAG: hypothetical protein EXQ58_07050 [Acidobacteria bacterium]|nr:hypothetical protein [Acidobacteriota bacterium]